MFRTLTIQIAGLLSGFVLLSSELVLADGDTEAPGVEVSQKTESSGEAKRVVPTRQRPGSEKRPIQFPPFVYESIPDIRSSTTDFVPAPDRWRQLYAGKWYDPYNQNVLKGDIPVFGEPGHEWFFEAEIISETVFERTKFVLPVGIQAVTKPGRLDTNGNGNRSLLIQNLITSFSLIRGNTTFMPPTFEFRVTPVFNFNYAEVEETGALRIDPSRGTERDEFHVGFLELFADVHLADLSHRYDFVSVRAGIQDFSNDFRGFLYSDQAPGVRFFGNWDNNKLQWNLGWFSRLDKDTNSGLNTTFDSRHENVFIANAYRQDLFALGHTVNASIVHRQDTAGDHGFHYDENGFLRRPASIGDEREKNIYSTYFGLAGDGHFDRVNTTTALYYVTGSESHNAIAGQGTDISAWFFAQELSYDFDWMRLRASVMWASGDKDPFDDDAEGFDAIFDVPEFAGGEFSYWQRQGLPLIGGGEVFLVNAGSFLPNFRASKEEGQSNFVNPGLRLFNLGVDFEVTPKIKLINNATFLQFDQTEPLKTVRQDGSFDRDIGYDLSSAVLYRPFLNNNVEFVLGGGILFPGDGLENLYGDQNLYHFFSNVILEY